MIICEKSSFKLKPDLVLMDLDNTLYDYTAAEVAAEDSIKIALNKKFGIKYSDFIEVFKKAKANVKKNLDSTASSHSRLLYIQQFLEIIGLGSKINSILELEQTYWFSFMENMKIYDNVIDFLEELRLSDVKCSIVTDLTTSIQIRKLMYLNLSDYFNNITTSEEVKFDKPFSKIFHKASEKSGNKINNIWMIGDSYEKDIVGAKNSINAKTILFSKNFAMKKEYKQADAIFSEYSELVRFFKKLVD